MIERKENWEGKGMIYIIKRKYRVYDFMNTYYNIQHFLF